MIWRTHLLAATATILATTSLSGVFATGLWWLPVALTIAVVIGIAAVMRTLGAPEWTIPLGGFLGLVTSLLVTAGGGWLFGLIPTPNSIRQLIDLAHLGVADAQSFTLPAPATPGLVLLTSATVGLVALLVAACCATPRLCLVSGAPLLLLYSVAAMIAPHGVSWPAFAAGTLGYLTLVLSAHRHTVGTWGRSTDRPRDTSAVFPLRWPGRVIALIVVAAALVFTAAIPGGSGSGLFSGVDWSSFGHRGRAVQAIHPMTQLHGQLIDSEEVELLRIRTTDNNPFYLRVATLDTFTGDGWTQSELRASPEDRVERGIERSRFLDRDAPTVRQRTNVEIRAFTESPYLPIYANPRSVDVRGDWRWDSTGETVFSTRTRTRDLRYSFESDHVQYTAELLEAQVWPHASDDLPKGVHAFTSLDREVPSHLNQLVKQLTGGVDNQYQAVLAINNYFSESNGFTYSEQTAPGTNASALDDFLTAKRGYCEQYASAMAYLVRAAGIPARVAIGFGSGTNNSAHDYISITNHNAHAWVEVLFDGLGWVPFDPTPAAGAGSPSSLPWVQDTAAGPEFSAPGADNGEPSATPGQESMQDRAADIDADMTGPPVIHTNSDVRSTVGWALITVALLAAAGSIPAGVRAWRKRRRLKDIRTGSASRTAELAWQEFVDTATDLGIPPRSTETPRDYEKRLIAGFDASAIASVQHLRRAYEHVRYATTSLTAYGLNQATIAATDALYNRASTSTHIRSTAWPASIFSRLS